MELHLISIHWNAVSDPSENMCYCRVNYWHMWRSICGLLSTHHWYLLTLTDLGEALS